MVVFYTFGEEIKGYFCIFHFLTPRYFWTGNSYTTYKNFRSDIATISKLSPLNIFLGDVKFDLCLRVIIYLAKLVSSIDFLLLPSFTYLPVKAVFEIVHYCRTCQCKPKKTILLISLKGCSFVFNFTLPSLTLRSTPSNLYILFISIF